jgi:hypothetical protein
VFGRASRSLPAGNFSHSVTCALEDAPMSTLGLARPAAVDFREQSICQWILPATIDGPGDLHLKWIGNTCRFFDRVAPAIAAMKTPYNLPHSCPNCGADFIAGDAYCGKCGQKTAVHRLTLHEIAHDLLHVFVHVDRSALSLVGLLLTRPGSVALEYVQGKRKRYFGPFASLFVAVAATSAALAFTGLPITWADTPNPVTEFAQTHINFIMFAEVPLLAAFSRILAARCGFNYAEHLVLAAYTSSMRFLFSFLVFIPVWFALRNHSAAVHYLYFASLPIWPLYYGFATSQFLKEGRASSWLRGIVAPILSWVSIQGMATLVASL